MRAVLHLSLTSARIQDEAIRNVKPEEETMPEATLAEEAAEMDVAFKPESGAAYELARMRHSAAHLMAEAVQEIFPDAKFAIGPAIEHGFYYDMDLPRPLSPDDLDEIERRMRANRAKAEPFVRNVVS